MFAKSYFVVPDVNEFQRLCSQLETSAQLRVSRALGLMMGIHSNQSLRLTGHHYATHPIEVATSLMSDFDCRDSDLIIIALLHDTIEDQSEKLAGFTSDGRDNPSNAGSVIEYLFSGDGSSGDYIATGVRALSNHVPASSDNRSKEQLYLEHVTTLFRRFPEIALVKCADIKQNAFRLEEIEDRERRLSRARKYRPVLEFIRDEIKLYAQISSHPLSAAAPTFLPELERQLSSWETRFADKT